MYLRNFLTKTHLQDLIESTALIHYESFRAKQLLALKEQSAAMSQHSAGQQRSVSGPYSR
jgi:septin 3/9/12